MSKFNIPRQFLFALSLLALNAVSAQDKAEREYTIKGSAIPATALDFINKCFPNRKVQWYREEGLNGSSIEAKLKSSGKSYSVEFSDAGKIQDVEILTRFNNLPDEVKSVMTKGFKESFRRFKVVKTQTQWSGSSELLKVAILNKELPQGVIIKYEMIIRARKADLSKYYEVLCDDRGKIKSIREIIQPNVDNLIY